MAIDRIELNVETRTEFGKGASRRARRDGKTPAVIYGHGEEPRHVLLPAHEAYLALRNPNQLLNLVEGSDEEMALPKAIQRNPLKDEIDHVDLLIVRKGERVVVDVMVVVEGEVAPGHEYLLEANTIAVEADALDLPDSIVVSVEGREAGQHIHAADLVLPEGVTLEIDDEEIILTVDEIVEQDLGEEDTGEEAKEEAAAPEDAAAADGADEE